MKNTTSTQQLHTRFKQYMYLSILTFVAVLSFSLLFIIFNDATGRYEFSIPIFVHYLGVFISSTMMILGIRYVRLLHNQLHLEFKNLKETE